MWDTQLHLCFNFVYTILAVHLLHLHSILVNMLDAVLCLKGLPHPWVFSSQHILFWPNFPTLITLSPTTTHLAMCWTKRTSSKSRVAWVWCLNNDISTLIFGKNQTRQNPIKMLNLAKLKTRYLHTWKVWLLLLFSKLPRVYISKIDRNISVWKVDRTYVTRCITLYNLPHNCEM